MLRIIENEKRREVEGSCRNWAAFGSYRSFRSDVTCSVTVGIRKELFKFHL